MESEWEREQTEEGLKVRPRRTRSAVFEEAGNGNIAVEHEQEQESTHETTNGDVAIDKDQNQEKGDFETCVYLDKDKGLWRCRYCIWTYCMESPSFDHVHNHKEFSNRVINAKKSPWQGPSFDLQITGTDGKGEFVSTKVNGVGTLTGEKEIENGTINIETKSSESQNGLQNSDGGDHLGSLISISNGNQNEVREKSDPTDSSMGANTNRGAVNGSKMVVDLDVEHVIKEQETHDLICPNCRATITKRVILCKRKRIAPSTTEQEKPNKQLTLTQPHEEATPAPAAANEDQETERTVFRCLSCFRFFIPTGTGFPCFRRSAGSEGLQSPQQEDLNCISSILELFRGKLTEIESGNDTIQHDKDIVQPLLQSSHPYVSEASTSMSQGNHEKEDRLVLLRPGPSLLQESESGNGGKLNGHIKLASAGHGTAHADILNSMNENNGVSVLIANGTHPQNPVVNGDSGAEGPENNHLEDDKTIPISSMPGDGAQVGRENAVKTTDVNSAGGGTSHNGIEDKLNLLRPARETIPEQSLINSNVPPLGRLVSGKEKLVGNPQPNPTEEGTLTASRGPETSTLITPLLQPDTIIAIADNRLGDSNIHEWDVIKSIVYGGLAESITSLGVVSSAAGSDATTLNIVTLALANLITGLFVIIHNLRELKKEHDSTNEGEKIDRYEGTLGKIGNFALHATAAVLSYILFGLLPPVVYGFSFRKSDNKEYKLIAVAAASLLCIILLAMGKAYAQKPPKSYVKTVLYYLSTGMAASGLSYAVGVLIHRALVKLGWLDSSAAGPSVATGLAFLETIPMKSGWVAF